MTYDLSHIVAHCIDLTGLLHDSFYHTYYYPLGRVLLHLLLPTCFYLHLLLPTCFYLHLLHDSFYLHLLLPTCFYYTTASTYTYYYPPASFHTLLVVSSPRLKTKELR